MARYLIQGKTYGGRVLKLIGTRSKTAAFTEAYKQLQQIIDDKSYEVHLYTQIEIIDTVREETVTTLNIPIEYLKPEEAYERFAPTVNLDHSPVKIDGVKYTVADILRHMDPKNYYARLDIWAKENGIVLL